MGRVKKSRHMKIYKHFDPIVWLSLASSDAYLLRSKHEPLSLTEEFLTGPFLGAHALSKRNHHITAN